MEKKCKGCGVQLQIDDSGKLGYVRSFDMDYCVRCFRMRHYNDHNTKDFVPDNDEVLNQLASLDGDYIWIMDIFDLDSSLNSKLAQFYKEHECHIILNKCDLLPKTINMERLKQYVLKRIKKLEIKSHYIITRGINDDFNEIFDSYILSDRPIILTGVANVGKSTVINQLLQDEVVTTNRYPATTITVNEIKTDKYHFYDTAGLWLDNCVVNHLDDNQLRVAVPVRTIRPTVFQIEEDQSYALGGIARVDISKVNKGTVVIYCANTLQIHRCKKDNASKYWQKHYQEMEPKISDCDVNKDMKHLHFIHKGKADYFISGLGFVTVVASNCIVDIYIDHRINVSKREAMI